MQPGTGQIWISWSKIFSLSRGNVPGKAAAEELPDQRSSLSRKPHTSTAYRLLWAVQVLVRWYLSAWKWLDFHLSVFWHLRGSHFGRGICHFLQQSTSQSLFSQSSGRCSQHEQHVTFCQRGGKEGRNERQRKNNQLARQKVRDREKINREREENKGFHKKRS